MQTLKTWCVALACLLPGLAAAQQGMVGGYAALGGCLEGCMKSAARQKVDDAVCQKYCPCALTIEGSRWREEMAPEAVQARQERCLAEAREWLESRKPDDKSRR